ncbi:hypothetical protein U9M48_005204 [Paspalum notatum var. saurae]|uniref:Gag-pol polyprotein n=1 Tax=Paspalum notatum var. saurae TaxID=547442 RepID=A0AAQ3PPN5_PASNO
MASMKYDIPLLDYDTRFSLWQVKMRAVLSQADLDDALDKLGNKDSKSWSDEERRRDRKALSQIHLHLSNNILQEVLQEKTAAALWLKLESICMLKDLTSKMHLKMKLFLHKLQEGGSVQNHLTVFKEIVSDLQAMEVKYEDEDLGLILLCSLPSSFANFRDTILYSRDTLTLNDVCEALQAKEKMKQMVSSDGSVSNGEALAARGRTEKKSNNGSRGKSSNGHHSRSKSRGRGNKFCYYCKKDNHVIADCYKLKNEKRTGTYREKNKSNDDGKASVAASSSENSDGDTLVAFAGCANNGDEWILDSGVSFHICINRDWFVTYDSAKSGGSVRMGDDRPCQIVGIRSVQIKMHDGIVRTLTDVRHIPDMTKNLISLSTLDGKGYKYSGGDGVLKVSKCSLVVMKADLKSANLYRLCGTTITVKSGGSVRMGDDRPCQIVGIGSIQIKMHDGIVRILTDIRHIPDMTKNLISLSTLDGKGYKYSGGDGVLKVSKGSLIVMKADLKSANLYRLRGTTITGYKLWYLQTQKVVLSRNVIFNKTARLSDNLSSDAPIEGQQKSSVQVEHFIDVDNTPENDNDVVQDAHIPDNSPIVDDSSSVEHSSPVVQPPQHSIAADRSVRTRKPTRRLIEECNVAYALSVAEEIEGNSEPSNYSEAITSADCNNWVTAMQDEMDEPARFKARLVAKGYSQIPGIDFNDVFSSVVKHSSICMLLSLVAMHDYELEQLDVKTAFLHGELDETIYMDQPEGFVVPGKENLICKLKKSLGLKQSPRQWYKRFDSFMLSNGFKRSDYDSCIYLKTVNGSAIYLLLYVDDMLIAAKEKSEIAKLKAQLNKEFEMKDLGAAKKILGMEIIRDRKSGLLYLSQRGYIEKVLRRFNMHDAKPVSTPLAAHFKLSSDLCPQSDDNIEYMSRVPYSSAVGSLMYAMVCSRLDLSHALSVVSRYMANPGKEHWRTVQWIFRYLRGTSSACLQFGKSRDGLVGYVDSDHAGDLDKRRSLTGYVFTVGGCAVSWKACLQATVALSTTEAEYMAISEACKEAIWLRGLYSELCGVSCSCVTIHCDSQSAIYLTKDQMFHERTKHIM